MFDNKWMLELHQERVRVAMECAEQERLANIVRSAAPRAQTTFFASLWKALKFGRVTPSPVLETGELAKVSR